MHAIFIPYGSRQEVEVLLRDMEAQKFFMPFKEGGGIMINGQIRVLPFGIYEYCFPKESADLVLHTLDFDTNRYSISRIILMSLGKMIKCEHVPKYSKEKYYLWIKENVNIIPLGVRYDGEIYDDFLKKTHEAI
jgi:hypothetical protein